MKKKISLHIFLSILMFAAAWSGASALPVSHYADNSRLAAGRWVKVSVPSSGLYRITNDQLRRWGFSQPEKVHVYGYGGRRIADRLTASNYIDDLPPVQQITDASGIVFYGCGPEEWVVSTGSYYRCKSNIYTNYGYYFLSDAELAEDDVPSITACGVAGVRNDAEKSFMERRHHENEISQPGEVGYTLVGESFISRPTMRLSFDTPDAVDAAQAWMECAVVSNISSATTLSFTANGRALERNSSDNVSVTAASSYISATMNVSRHSFEHQGASMEIGVTFNNASSAKDAWLDYISVNYRRHLRLPSSGVLEFSSSNPALALTGTGVTVWDVTDPGKIVAMNTSAEGGMTGWLNDYHGMRSYVAFTSGATLPAPTFVKQVVNQNLHAQAPTEMIIISVPAALDAAERIAQLHRESEMPLSVTVVNAEDVYNEFSSGMADVSGLRKYLKMNYDRSLSCDTLDRLGYVLLMGHATTDNRHLSAASSSMEGYTLPVWMGGLERSQYSDNDAFGTDDFIAILGDDTGTSLGLDDLSVAVGRIPVTSASQAKTTVDKLEQYLNRSKKSAWKNQFLFLCDSGDNGIHAKQTETMIKNMAKADNNQNLTWRVYADCYALENGEYKGARNELYRHLEEGVVWWNYIGHANNHSLSHGNIVTYNDLNNFYLNKLPILFAATCDFLRWDSTVTSGGELLFFERYGGTIAMISATRPVYISDNGYFTAAMGRALLMRDSSGRHLRAGEIYRRAKNNILDSNGDHRPNTNRLRFVYMGDPALPLIMPSNVVRLDSIDGKPLDDNEQHIVSALSRPVFSGTVRTPQGDIIEDFNGNVDITVYDAEQSTSTLVDDAEARVTYDQQGSKIYMGVAKVNNGRFSITAALPAEITDNFRPATINMYAYSGSDTREAVGVNSGFYVYGTDTAAEPDTIAPVIDYIVLNHESFRSGDTVNESPMLIASVSDNVGLNVSTNGVGHQMNITLDSTTNYNDASLYFTPSADDPASGIINYPLDNLMDGAHTLRLRIWDTTGNSTTKEIEFFVETGLSPKIFDIYTDTNPATTEANFYISHNRPDQLLNVTVTVYNLMGKTVWSGSAAGMADMFTSAPVTWDLTDFSGRRVQRGIYLYRAQITDRSGLNYDTGSRRIAVAAQ